MHLLYITVSQTSQENSDTLQQLDKISSVTDNKNVPMFVYCYSGGRSRQATYMLQHMGYTNVQNIGGIAAYSGKVER
jgi:rhodanese-related sulfurtransferase